MSHNSRRSLVISSQSLLRVCIRQCRRIVFGSHISSAVRGPPTIAMVSRQFIAAALAALQLSILIHAIICIIPVEYTLVFSITAEIIITATTTAVFTYLNGGGGMNPILNIGIGIAGPFLGINLFWQLQQ